MKKLIVLVAFLLVGAACSTEPPASNAPAINANTATVKPAAPTEADVTAREKATWDAIKKKDIDGLANMLASDYLEIGGDGVFNKDGITADLKHLTLDDYSMSGVKLTTIDKDAYLLTYDVTIKGNYNNQPIPAGPYHAGAAWVNRDGKWLVIYYQESRAVPPPPAPPSGSALPAAKAAASPTSTSSPAAAASAATGPDAVANEKTVWAALKSKDYDAFASLLAPDAIEVEPTGVYDKAGSVKGVSAFDFSKATLDDWKTVRFDNDVSLVTYTLHLPGPKPTTERHSTIWANRDGKWQAIYHQGTTVEAPPAAAKPSATPTK